MQALLVSLTFLGNYLVIRIVIYYFKHFDFPDFSSISKREIITTELITLGLIYLICYRLNTMAEYEVWWDNDSKRKLKETLTKIYFYTSIGLVLITIFVFAPAVYHHKHFG
jgi:hypothetical protein